MVGRKWGIRVVMAEKENQRCFVCEHCFIAHDYEFTCELTHKTVNRDGGAVCKHFKEENEDE